MIPQIIAGITVTSVFIGYGISIIFYPKPKEIYPEICITEYHELPKLKWYDSSDSEE